MNTEPTQIPKELTAYLRTLEAALHDAPAEARAEILADVRAHASDALDEGRSIEEALAGFGPAHEAVAQFRSELGLSDMPTPDTGRGSAMLHGAAVVIAVLTGCFVAFLIPSFTPMARNHAQYVVDSPATLMANYGLGVALLAFIPALLAVLPLVLPQSARMPVAVANASLVAILAAMTFGEVGMFYVPLAVLMWAAVVVPWRVAHGLDLARSPLWRIFGGLLLALPGLMIFGGMLIGSLLFYAPGVLVALVLVALGSLFALGLRAAYYLIASIGFVGLLLAMLDPGFLTLAVWWAGGAYLVIGLSAVATLRPRAERGAEA